MTIKDELEAHIQELEKEIAEAKEKVEEEKALKEERLREEEEKRKAEEEKRKQEELEKIVENVIPMPRNKQIQYETNKPKNIYQTENPNSHIENYNNEKITEENKNYK